jgi:hypothetical protein
MYVEGKPFERGVANGKLAQELIQLQEEYFVASIKNLIPSESYLNFLKYFTVFFNRNMPDHVRKDYQEEIFGISHSFSPKFNFIGTNYERNLNYHAAHDIGHALQEMGLVVGCTSFSVWGNKSQDGSLLIGRNFDFYTGDDFAKDKMVMFTKPDSGYGFMTITWGGFIGAASGMNEKGLTVTINAAKSDFPTSAAAPSNTSGHQKWVGTVDSLNPTPASVASRPIHTIAGIAHIAPPLPTVAVTVDISAIRDTITPSSSDPVTP